MSTKFTNNATKTSSNPSATAGANDKQQLKYIATVVRALVTSRKPPCRLREILNEYPTIEGKPLPFRNFGFNSPEEFLKETGEFTFKRYGTEVHIIAKPSNKSDHISSMVRQQKQSKYSNVVRQPQRTDLSWNKSTFSSNIFKRVPPPASCLPASGGDRGYNPQINNRNNISGQQQQQKQPDSYRQPQQQQRHSDSNRQPQKQLDSSRQPQQPQKHLDSSRQSQQQQRHSDSNRQPQQQQKQQSQPNQKHQDSNQQPPKQPLEKQKDLRVMLNSKVQQQLGATSDGGVGNKPDLRERLNLMKQQQLQKESSLKDSSAQKANSPRAILGHNNGNGNKLAAANQSHQNGGGYGDCNDNNPKSHHRNNAAEQQLQKPQQQQQQYSPPQQQQQVTRQQQQQVSPQQHQQVLSQQQASAQLIDPVARASSIILAQRGEKDKQLQQHPERALQSRPSPQYSANGKNLTMRTRSAISGTASGGGGGGGAASLVSSVQNRLKSFNNDNNNNLRDNIYTNNGGNSAGNTPQTSPAISSPGSEQMSSPFGYNLQQQPQFHKQPRYSVQKEREPILQSVIPPKVFQFNPKLDPITSLSQYCIVRRFEPPIYSTFKSKFSRLHQCRVNVNNTIFSTYPNEYPNEILAKISCAQKAIEQLRQQEARQPLPPCTDSDHELIIKLYNELLEHPNGIFAKNIPECFETKFEQLLPEHWWTLVQTSKKFTTETGANNIVILFANTNFATDESLDCTSATIIQMEAITLPWSQKYWQLYVTHCASTVDVWARLFGKEYSDRLDAVMNDIDVHMLTEKVRPLSIACNSIYLVCMSECWHRVRVEEMDKLNATARCFFIDFGDTEWLPVNELHICEAKFLQLPAQAVPFSLFGLEDFADNPNARRHLDAVLPSKSVVGEVLTKESDFYNTNSSVCGKIQVVLYDTSSPEDVNLNPLLLNQICNDTPPPEIKHKGATSVIVTHVNDDGELYLQIVNSDLKYVQKLLQQLVESKFKREQHKVSINDLKRSNLFLICDDSSTQTNWYRGALTDAPFKVDDDEFEIFYVDHGVKRRTHISKIFRLESLSAALSKFPRQAIKARLYNIPAVNKSIVGRIRALLPTNCAAFVKLDKPGEIPFVTAYRRHESSDMLCNINEDIRMEHELECSATKFNTDYKAEIANNGGSGGGLSSSTVSKSFTDMRRGITITSVPNSPQKLGELQKLKNYEDMPRDELDFFEVRVTMSANPSNFTIQPYKDYPRLRTLMKELQEYCENNDDFIPADMVEIGQAYAALNPDGFYHRVTVVNTYNGEMIHVCFCDFGDIAVLRSDQLKILPAKFRQLPKMAITAKLYGIKAKNGDWSLEDCLRFRELTVGQKFVASIKKISYDKLNTPETQVLELELIDVTTDEDIFIHQILLNEERAVKEA